LRHGVARAGRSSPSTALIGVRRAIGTAARRVLATVLALALWTLAWGAGGQAPAAPHTHWGEEGERLIAALRQGGHAIFFRHERTAFDEVDAAPPDFADCARQRALSAAGRESALATGEALRRLAVPIGAVLASPYCRNVETARLLAGRVDPTPALLGPERSLGRDAAATVADLERLVATHVRPGANAILVGHFGNLLRAAGVRLAEGEAALLALSPDGRVRVLRTLPPSLWDDLAHDEARRARGRAAMPLQGDKR
jgi:phosphohistidine phosphatase SixA